MDLATIERELETSIWRDSLAETVRGTWFVHSPTTPLQWSWHLDVSCAHLQAQILDWACRQSDPTFVQKIQNLLITEPPGTLKSRLLMVAQAWAWARWPSLTMLALSGNPRIATRDSMLFRQVVTSKRYREVFRPTWTIREDQDAKGSLGNTAGGIRMAMGWGANAIGEHVDWIIADDPHDPEQVESDATRIGVLDRWDTSWANRVNDLASSIRTGIAQRTHEADWSAARIAEGYVHLDLPMTFEPERECVTPLGRPDPRTVDGESLQPDRFTVDVLRKERTRVGEQRWATLYQGRPTPAGGAIVKLDWLRWHRAADWPDATSARPKGCWTGPSVVTPETFSTVCIAADLAMGRKTKAGDFNVVLAVGKQGSSFFVLDVWRARADFPEVETQFVAMARRWPLARKVIERAAAGGSLEASLRLEIPGLLSLPAQGSKLQRLHAVLSFFEAANVHFDEHRTDIEELVTELITFPRARHDDFVDALSLALSQCALADANEDAGGPGGWLVDAGSSVDDVPRGSDDGSFNGCYGGPIGAAPYFGDEPTPEQLARGRR